MYASFLYFLKRIVFVKRHVWFFRIYVIAFDKFTIPDDKFFRIEINEKNGGRHVLFDLENGDIVNVSDI